MRVRAGFFLLTASLASILLVGIVQPAQGRDGVPAGKAAPAIRIAGGSLAAALRTLAQATGAEIVSLEPEMARQRVSAMTLPGDTALALDALLQRTDFRAIRLGGNSYRIERRPHRSRKPPFAPTPQLPDPEGPADREGIVVQGKFPTPLRNYPGSVGRLQFDASNSTLSQPTDLDGVSRRLPIVSGTAFGDGRDKLFVRGIADSSFNGASQPTTGVYFGDALIGFGSPNPNLKLYDIRSVEILEGPQGTLYGAGSIGGVMRITPNPVELGKTSTAVLAGASLTAQGGPGWKAAGVVNLPLVSDKAGIRLVAYDDRQGGYIDDPVLGSNINRVNVAGGRLAFATARPGEISIELGGLYQSTKADDAQYADRTGRLRRSAALAQPFSSELALGRFSFRKRWASGLTLTSVASIGHRSAFDRFDYSLGQPRPTAYELQRSSSMFANETRLASDADAGVAWVAGVSIERVQDGQSRALGKPDDANPLDEVTNITRSGSLFGQARVQLSPVVEGTLGLRFTMARTDSQPARGGVVSFVKGDLTRHFDPTAAVLWHATPDIAVYGRFQTSFRNGGVTVARGVGKVADFNSDSIVMGEVGFRLTPRGTHGVALSAALSSARWRNVLAELVTPRGIPITSNLGNAQVNTVEASIDWTGPAGWSAGGGFLYTANHLVGDLPMQSDPRKRLLPDVPRLTANGLVSYSWSGRNRTSYTVTINGQYVGRSVLGPGALFDLDQGDFVQADARLLAQRGPVSVLLSAENLFNTHANRFSLGNPLLLSRREGFVPVRPRTVSAVLGISW